MSARLVPTWSPAIFRGRQIVRSDNLLILREYLRFCVPDPGKATGPVVAVAGEQAHAIAVALNDQPIAVILDFVEPGVRRRHRLADGRETGLERASHGPKIAPARNCESALMSRSGAGISGHFAVDLAEGQLDGPVLAIAGGLVPVDEPSGLFVRIFFPGRHLVAEAPVDRNPSSSKMPLANNQAA